MKLMWVPGVGDVPAGIAAQNKAVYEYDERLFFAQNPENGEWCVYYKMPHGVPSVPVLSFGRSDYPPPPEVITRRLYEQDTRVHGEEVLNRMLRHNEALKEGPRRKAEEADWILAEAMESFMHRQGMTPYFRSLSKEWESKKKR